jgi:hypothetical protein
MARAAMEVGADGASSSDGRGRNAPCASLGSCIMRASLDQKANAVETRSGTGGPPHASLGKPEPDTDEGCEAMRAPSLALLTLLTTLTPALTPAWAQSPGNRGATSRQNQSFEYQNQ